MADCSKSYTDPSSLRKHIKTVHGEDVYEMSKRNKPVRRRRNDVNASASTTNSKPSPK